VQQLAAVRGRLLGSLISAQEEERRRIARELHDETGQTVSSIMLELARVRDALPPDQTEARDKLSAARELAQRTLQGLRDLINDLRPEVLDQLGLEPAVRSYIRSRLESRGVKAKLDCSGLDGRVPPEVETTAFRVIQEAVANTRHSGATSVDIRMEATDSTLTGAVTDDGKGFDVDAAMQAAGSWGLRGMRERVSVTGGNLSIESEPGRGTRVEFQIPLEGV
jgi:signal transduction histidine kinase